MVENIELLHFSGIHLIKDLGRMQSKLESNKIQTKNLGYANINVNLQQDCHVTYEWNQKQARNAHLAEHKSVEDHSIQQLVSIIISQMKNLFSHVL